jgi:hypothetical protein
LRPSPSADAKPQALTVITTVDQDGAIPKPGARLASDTLYVGVGDGSGRLLSLKGDFFALSPASAEILELLLVRPLKAALQELYSIFDAPESLIRKDVSNLLTALHRRRLITSNSRYQRVGNQKYDAPLTIQSALLNTFWRVPVGCSQAAWALLALARLSCRLWGWSTSLACWKRFLSYRCAYCRRAGYLERAAAIDETVRRVASRHPMGMSCKERALVCWFLLAKVNIPADLVLGINLYPLSSHCWCESSGHVFSDDWERCRRYEAIYRYRLSRDSQRCNTASSSYSSVCKPKFTASARILKERLIRSLLPKMKTAGRSVLGRTSIANLMGKRCPKTTVRSHQKS